MLDLVSFFSNILKKLGLDTYIKRCEFSAHIAWGLVFPMISLWLIIPWTLFVLWDEFYCDEHWKVFIGDDPEWPDLLWDLFSKLFGSVLILTIKVIFGV